MSFDAKVNNSNLHTTEQWTEAQGHVHNQHTDPCNNVLYTLIVILSYIIMVQEMKRFAEKLFKLIKLLIR